MSLTGPLLIDTAVNNGVGSFFFNPPIFFNVGSTRYAIIQKSTGNPWRLRAYKLVAGAWVEKDAGNGPTTSRGVLAGLQTPFSCPTGIIDPTDTTKIVIAYAEPVASNLSIVRFDTTTDTFEAALTTTGPVVHGVDLVFPTIPPNSVCSDDTGSKCCMSYRASDNKFLFNFQGVPEVVAGDNCSRPYYATFDRGSSTWSAATIIAVTGEDLPYLSHGLLTDSATNISYATIVKPNNGKAPPNDTTYEIWYVQIDANDTIHAKVSAATDVRHIREPEVGYPSLQKLNGKTIINIPYTDNAAAGFLKARVARAYVGVAPVFVQENLSTSATDGPVNDSFLTPSIAIGDDGNAYAFWAGSPAPDFAYRLFQSKTGDIGVGWDAPTTLVTTNPVTDFLERPTVTSLLGINNVATIAIAIMDGVISPLAEGAIYFELDLSAVAPAAGGTQKLQFPNPVILPDPRVLCDHAQQKMCVPFEGKEMDFQITKGVYFDAVN